MGKDDFWLGAVGAGLVLYGAYRLHVASYQRGWNGEELKSQGLLGIFGWTRNGALVLTHSFNQGKHDREVRISLNVQAGRIDSIHKQTQDIINLLNKLEQDAKNQPKAEIPVEERKFLSDLHNMAKNRLVQPQPNSRQKKSYVA